MFHRAKPICCCQFDASAAGTGRREHSSRVKTDPPDPPDSRGLRGGWEGGIHTRGASPLSLLSSCEFPAWIGVLRSHCKPSGNKKIQDFIPLTRILCSSLCDSHSRRCSLRVLLRQENTGTTGGFGSGQSVPEPGIPREFWRCLWWAQDRARGRRKLRTQTGEGYGRNRGRNVGKALGRRTERWQQGGEAPGAVAVPDKPPDGEFKAPRAETRKSVPKTFKSPSPA